MTDQSSDGGRPSTETRADGGTDQVTEYSLEARELTDLVRDHAVALLDADGRIATWNRGAREVMRYDEDAVLDEHYRVFFPAEERESDRPARLLERADREGRAEDEGWRVRDDDGRLWVREVIAPIRDDGSVGRERAADEELVGFCWFVHDRTDEHERERELESERAFTESVFAAQPDILYAFDADGTPLAWNDRVPEVTGYSESELPQLSPFEFVAPEHRERIADAIRRVLEERESVAVEADLLTRDDARIPYEFNSARMTDEDGDVLGFTGVGRDVSEHEARERELREERALTESIFEAQPDLLYAYDADRNLIHWNDRFREVVGYGPDELAGMEPLAFIAADDRERIGEAIERILSAGARVTAEAHVRTRDGTRIPYEFNSARMTDEDGTVLGFTGVGRDVSARKARERELERLERLNAVVRTIDETMVTAETRDEVERAIVEAFADADAYRFAAIGRVDTAGASDQWEPRAWAGIDRPDEDGTVASFVDPPPAVPGRSVTETQTVMRYRSLHESPVDEWRADARERGYRSVAVVPIAASGRTFGVLVVAATEPSAFSDREREVLLEFGGTIGHAINAMAVRRLLYVDTTVELEFGSTDRQDVLVDLSARADCRLSLDHVLSATDEEVVYYATVTDVDPGRFRDVADTHPDVREHRHIETTDDESHWELVVTGPTPMGLLAEYGARIRSKVVDVGESNAVVQVSPDVDVRELVDAITSTYPETTLRSKRSVDRQVETRGDFRRRVRESLTEKQRIALEAAYYGGYFEWPTRTVDAGEIAGRLGIARQTFHQHLRVAEEKLLAAYFETDA